MAAPGDKTPQLNKGAFACPFCNAYAHQTWCRTQIIHPQLGCLAQSDIRVAICGHCGHGSVWYNAVMVYPATSTAPMAAADLPDELKSDFEEARAVFERSPRAAAALLRLLVEKLCGKLADPEASINDNIKALVKKGLPATIQQALDTVRVVGNHSVHAGTIDLNDKPEVAAALFGLVNFIVERMITEPKQIGAIFENLPAEDLKRIAKRDGQ